jgi:hypothetical protein
LLASQKSPETQKRANQRELVWGELIKAKLIDEDPDYEGSELREDQSPCAKKLFFMDTNHIFTELLQKKRLPMPFETLAGHECKFGVFGQKWSFSRCLHQGLIFTDLKYFLYGVYWDQDQQPKHPENAGNSI